MIVQETTQPDVLARRLLDPLYRLIKEPHEKFEDWRLSVTTRDKPVLRELGIPSAIEKQQGLPHRAVSYSVARRAIGYVRPTSADALLDLGCGSGRLICLAAKFAFSRLIGVELDPGLAAIAARNAGALRRAVVHPEVVCADAADFQIPDDITVVWMANPFHGDVFRSALTRITESYDRRPRRLRLVYHNPREHGIVTAAGRFRQIEALRWWPYADNTWFRRINVYEVVAP